MPSSEGSPVPSDDTDPQLAVILGDGPLVWSRTPEAFNVKKPISADLFAGSNLMRKLQPYPRVKSESYRGRITEIPTARTSLAAMIGEVYRRCLPPESRDLAAALEQQASAEEIAYEAEGIGNDPEYRAQLAVTVQVHADSLVMQGFEAFSEAAYDFAGGNQYDDLIRDAQRFAAYLIETSMA